MGTGEALDAWLGGRLGDSLVDRLGGADGLAQTDGDALGIGDADASHATMERATMRSRAAARRQPGGIGLVGVVLEPTHRGQGRIPEQLRLALEQGQLGAEAGRGVGCLQQTLLAR